MKLFNFLLYKTLIFFSLKTFAANTIFATYKTCENNALKLDQTIEIKLSKFKKLKMK